jgi:hypothetical protein
MINTYLISGIFKTLGVPSPKTLLFAFYPLTENLNPAREAVRSPKWQNEI